MFVSPEQLELFEKAREHFKWHWPNSRVILLCPADFKPTSSKYKTFGDLVRSPPASAPEPFDNADCNETAWLCYSSGTTGLPKGVMTTNYNFTTQLCIGPAAFPKMIPGRDAVLGFLPFSHMYGLWAVLMQPLSFGAPAVILPRFDEVQALAAIERVRR